MKFKTPIPAVILGAPIPGSENPVLASPIASLVADLDFKECSSPTLKALNLEGLGGLLEDFWSKLASNLNLKLCSTLKLFNIEGAGRAPLSGLYASLTSLMLHALHRFHGDIAQPLDVVETASLVDLLDTDTSWRLVLEALRYSTLTGRLVAYRGPLEVYVFERVGDIKLDVGARVEGVRSLVSRDSLGYNVYGALIHLMGEAVLEASTRIREGSSLVDVIAAFKPIHDGVTLAVYNLKPSGDKCFWSPGIPWSFEELCLVV